MGEMSPAMGRDVPVYGRKRPCLWAQMSPDVGRDVPVYGKAVRGRENGLPLRPKTLMSPETSPLMGEKTRFMGTPDQGENSGTLSERMLFSGPIRANVPVYGSCGPRPAGAIAGATSPFMGKGGERSGLRRNQGQTSLFMGTENHKKIPRMSPFMGRSF